MAETPTQPDTIHAEDPAGFLSSTGIGPIERNRPVRPPLFPRPLLWTLVALLGACLLGVGSWAVYANTALIAVPDVVGRDADVARTQLAREGLKLVVAGERFASEPKGRVLEQSPSKDVSLKRGGTVRVVVSAGTEDFAMPDVVRMGLNLARDTLQGRGLRVRVDTQVSDEPSNTVLASNPAPGATVRTGDVVRLTVSSASSSAAALLPYDMSGIAVVIDPAPAPAGQSDAPAEVARRLRSLLEASGAQVVVTRSAIDTVSATPQARAAKALEATATTAIGIDVAGSGAAGLALMRPATGAASLVQASGRLSSLIATQLAGYDLASSQQTIGTDVVFTSLTSPWVRVRLGSTASREDAGNFRDPRWSDAVARALYRSIGEQFGRKQGGGL